MHTSRDTQSERNAEGRTVPTQFEVSRKDKEGQNQSTLDQVYRLIKNMGAPDDRIIAVLRGISGSHSGQENKNHTDSTDEQFAKLRQARVLAQHPAKYLADKSKLYERFH